MMFLVNSVEQTYNIGFQIGQMCKSGDIICLVGDLGTGKTHLTKGIAKGLNIDDHITSPTFTIVNEYEGRLKLYHFDVYRVNDPDEIEAIGFDEYIFSDGVSIIEWANYIEDLIPQEDAMYIYINKIEDQCPNNREIKFEFTNPKYNYVKEINI
ncbi:tRNA (adenosine(37)-N6)-threonylcarbamoyltransferase complex ATPase subunit type 1 TsaE [Hathewaya massiliensis]|uniref:tRNA (adenosine(37)-N6)-threonylcarbamoyltransferase complex ATPase subunit type 1 TsaE n=1 Tax=Hathewaya massiliensis TaxID=1964382 RepID=UPI001158A542|nr:tRNA (adenosine(37)-N6)-threonylcarbamoyltransferase complex ATPase subunit type 1 TsaE [Hathewaya massiliensis]